jgi:hypothetical protein
MHFSVCNQAASQHSRSLLAAHPTSISEDSISSKGNATIFATRLQSVFHALQQKIPVSLSTAQRLQKAPCSLPVSGNFPAHSKPLSALATQHKVRIIPTVFPGIAKVSLGSPTHVFPCRMTIIASLCPHLHLTLGFLLIYSRSTLKSVSQDVRNLQLQECQTAPSADILQETRRTGLRKGAPSCNSLVDLMPSSRSPM